MAEPIEIQTPFIKLEQLLKLAGAFPTGGGCKEAIQSGQVRVNGAVCLLRGKKLRPGDEATFDGHAWQVKAP